MKRDYQNKQRKSYSRSNYSKQYKYNKHNNYDRRDDYSHKKDDHHIRKSSLRKRQYSYSSDSYKNLKPYKHQMNRYQNYTTKKNNFDQRSYKRRSISNTKQYRDYNHNNSRYRNNSRKYYNYYDRKPKLYQDYKRHNNYNQKDDNKRFNYKKRSRSQKKHSRSDSRDNYRKQNSYKSSSSKSPEDYYRKKYDNKSNCYQANKHNFKKYTDSNTKNKNRSMSSSNSLDSDSSTSSYRKKDAGHFKYRIGQRLGEKGDYIVNQHLGDGTFGRILLCNKQYNDYAVKIIRGVKRYNESAEIEAKILKDLKKVGGQFNAIVQLIETFWHYDTEKRTEQDTHYCMVFETLGQSLYDFIKHNSYKGFCLKQIQSFAKQSLIALEFIHKQKLTHTDLKPENILLKKDQFQKIKNQNLWPIQVLQKKNIYGNNKYDEDSDNESQTIWYKPLFNEIKLIDFGGATYESEHHTSIINTRQYRAPEVILGCCQWDQKSDIWSMGCILIELYIGELFFPTHDNIEHLALMEKQCGAFPKWMASNTKYKEFYSIFDLNYSAEKAKLKWPQIAKRNENIDNYNDMKVLNEIIQFDKNEDHKQFKMLLEQMFKLDPKERINAKECLDHQFFKLNIYDETDISKLNNNESINSENRFESKSTEKTRGSTYIGDKNQINSPCRQNLQ